MSNDETEQWRKGEQMLPKELEKALEGETECPNCGHHTGGETTCDNCGAILGQSGEGGLLMDDGDDLEEL
jgi:ribosomal protein L32